MTNNRRSIAEQIAVLLSHYWTGNDDPALRKAQASDWLVDLDMFAASVVKDSCTVWRRNEQRRPTPSDIRKLCLELQPRPSRQPMLPAPTLPAVEPRERYREAAEAREAWARDHGCNDFAEAMQVGLMVVARRKLGERVEPAQLADVTIKDPALVRQARERLGIRLPYADDEAQAAAL